MKFRNSLLFLLVLLVVAAGFLMPQFLPAAVKEGGTLDAPMVDIPLTKDSDDLWRWGQFGKYLDGRGLYEVTDITYRYSSEDLVAYMDSFCEQLDKMAKEGFIPPDVSERVCNHEARSLKIEYVFNKNELNGFTMLSFYCYGSSDIRFVMDAQTGKILYIEAIGQAWSSAIDIHAGENDNASYTDTLQGYARYLALTPLTDSVDLMHSMGVEAEPYSFLKAELFCTTADNAGQYLRLAVVKDLDYLCLYLFGIYK